MTMKTKYLILGAGPSGLTIGNMLKDKGITDFLILEKENEAGGLCRSKMVDNAPLDIGGGHFLDVRRPKVNEFLFRFMPEDEWEKFSRDSRIYVNDQMISHPIEANIWQMTLDQQVDYLKSIACAGCNSGKEMPTSFVDWIYWKLGEKVASDYMIPYNQKMFGNQLNELGTYWLEKLPNVSFEETLRSCLTKQPYGTQPGHVEFYYPKKYGYGELWLRMATAIRNHIIYSKAVKSIDFNTRTVRTTDGCLYCADKIITTIPWAEFSEIIGMPNKLADSIRYLKHTSVQVEYVPENMDTQSHWIYYPDSKLPYHRILVRHNFCLGSRGYWTETNADRVTDTSLERTEKFVYLNEYAYPLNTIEKPAIMKELLTWCESKNVFGVGRWGEHQHYNSDTAVEVAMNFVTERLNVL